MLHYHVEILEQRHVEQIKLVNTQKEVVTSLGETLVAPQVIIATGASWRKLGVPGEAEHIGRGVDVYKRQSRSFRWDIVAGSARAVRAR